MTFPLPQKNCCCSVLLLVWQHKLTHMISLLQISSQLGILVLDSRGLQVKILFNFFSKKGAQIESIFCKAQKICHQIFLFFNKNNNILKISSKTSMHSSRMRTARLLPASPSMHCTGGCLLLGGCLLREGVCSWGGVSASR